VRPLPGAPELLSYLTRSGISWAIATSGRMETAGPVLDSLEVDLARIPVITRDLVERAKPDPDLFLAAADALEVDIATACVVGDSIWDMLAARRAGAPGVGLLSGGYGRDELSVAAPIVSTRTRPICCDTSTKSAVGPEVLARSFAAVSTAG
jgi:phosphoglycolate phosphatase-like HAD superfamily hydrolase